MKNLKISNELLSAVLGCECEFVKIDNVDIYFEPKNYKQFYEKPYNSSILSNDDDVFFKINLDTFIHIAVDEWAFKEKSIKVLISWNKLDKNKIEYKYIVADVYHTKIEDRKIYGKEERIKDKREAFIKALELLV